MLGWSFVGLVAQHVDSQRKFRSLGPPRSWTRCCPKCAAYSAMIRAENETDHGFQCGCIVAIIGPIGSDWNEGTLVKGGPHCFPGCTPDFVNALNSAVPRPS